MAQPTQYERQNDFTERDGDDTNHAAVNIEFDAVALTTDEIRANLVLIQRDDGALKNGVVTADSLDGSAFSAVQASVEQQRVLAEQAALSAQTSAVTANNARDAAIVARIGSETARDSSALNANNASASAATATTQATNSAASASASQTSANASSASATQSATSATNANTSAGQASTSAAAAASSQTAANNSAAASAASAGQSAASATTATTRAGEAATSANQASASAASALTSKNDAAASAATSATNASTSTTAANTATTKAAEASTSATNAAASASTANSAAASAVTANSAAQSAAGTATTQAGIATTKAGEALASASGAAASAVSAASSAASAASLLDNFDDRYLGAKTADPSVDNDGNPLVISALYFNTSGDGMKVYTSVGWVVTSSAQVATMATFEYVATSGQTVFSGNDVNTLSLSYTAPALIVTLNGSRLRPGDEYTATDGVTLTLATGANLGDELVIDAFGSFEIADTYSRAQADARFEPIDSAYTKAQSDSLLSDQLARGLFRKANPDAVAFTKTGNGTATTASVIYVEVNGSILTIASNTSITMPTLVAGTDYAIWVNKDTTVQATSNHTSPPQTGSRKIGGFHYAPGGNATAQSGGNTTPQINEYSFWDLKFRPACPDPRGMTLVAGGFWSDIYLTGVDAITNGSSKYNVTMADGSSPPKVPTMFGGNGSTTYGSYTWFEAQELATFFGKRTLTQQEFMAAMYGTTEASSVGADQGSTVLNAAYTSKWGVVQASGVLWIWGRDRGGPFAAASWNANTEGRGSEYNAPNAARFGGPWDYVSISGSRCSAWVNAASFSTYNVGSRFVCDHLQLD